MAVVTETVTADATPAGSRSETIAFLIMVAVLVIAPFFVYPLFLMQALCFALFACAFNLLIGYVGLLSFGHALYFGWASYLAAHAAKVWGFPPEFAILTGAATGAVLGVIAGSLAIRRQGIYFAMITLALAQMMYFFALQAKFTGGEDGIQGVPRGKLFGLIDLTSHNTMYVLVLVIFLACFLLLLRIINSPFRGPQGDPQDRATRDFARLQDRSLQAGGFRAFGDAGRRRRRHQGDRIPDRLPDRRALEHVG